MNASPKKILRGGYMDKELEYWIEYWMMLKKQLRDFRRWR